MTKSLKPVKSAPLGPEGAAPGSYRESIEPAQAEQTSVAQDQSPRTELTRIDQARIKRWVANRLID